VEIQQISKLKHKVNGEEAPPRPALQNAYSLQNQKVAGLVKVFIREWTDLACRLHFN